MNKEDSQRLINKFKSNQLALNSLEHIAIKYDNQSIPHNLDKKVLFQIELLHEKLGAILLHLYRGDLQQKNSKKIIEIDKLFADYQYMSSSFLYDEQYINDFSVKGKEFAFNLEKGSCYRIAKGVCSLNINEKEINNLLKIEFEEASFYSDNYEKFIQYAKGKEDSILYCRDLAESIKKNGFKSRSYINHYKCNHYGFTDGQHRVCIASKIDIRLPANVCDMTSEDSPCAYCEMKINEEKSIEFKNQLLISSLKKKPIQRLLSKFKHKTNEDIPTNASNFNYSEDFLEKM